MGGGGAAARGFGVVVLGHGSRAGGAAAALARTAAKLAERLECPVLPASLQFNRPTLEEACRRLAGEGVARIVVVPYFLFNGNHMRHDIPEELERIRARLPGGELELAEHLGEDDSLVEVLARRVAAASTDGDGAGGAAGSAGTAPREPAAIEAESFAVIDELLAPGDPEDPRYQVVRRVVHTTGDPGMAGRLRFSPGAVAAGLAALADGGRIVCDVNMVAAGVAPTAGRLGIEVLCGIASPEAARLAGQEGITRAAAAMQLLAAGDDQAGGTIVAVGNAPTALFACLELARRGRFTPSLVVGVPVGFVGAAESKEALADSGLEHITIPGRRGGSGIAVAIVNALMNMLGKEGT